MKMVMMTLVQGDLEYKWLSYKTKFDINWDKYKEAKNMRYRYAHIDFKRYIEYYRLYLTKKMKERIKYQRYLRSMDQVMDVWYFVDHLVHDRKGYLPITQNLFVDL